MSQQVARQQDRVGPGNSEQGSPAADHELLVDDLDDPIPSAGYHRLPVVGLGGSAGATPALLRFFQKAPVDGGVAYVVVLHMSPDHESMLPAVLQRATTMRVVQVFDSEPLQADTVYVVAPGKVVQRMNGSVGVVPFRRTTARHVTVDLFFRTLADTHGPHAVAVVLSGMHSDGAVGIRRVKERGGLTIAQDPDDAEISSMPRAALATDMVDWVLPAGEMAERVIRYLRLGQQVRLPPEDGPQPLDAAPGPAGADDGAQGAAAPLPSAAEEAELREVLAFLHKRSGRDFSYYKRATILRRIGRRMQVNSVDNLSAYLGCLRTLPGESGALLQDLLISVTNFFRDPECFAGLEASAWRLFHGKSVNDTVRAWVVACATGEEAYSVAMLLAEYARRVGNAPQIQIFATDLDEEALRVAREGVYPLAIETDVSPERLQRFFVREHRGWRVRRELREMVLFAPHDLLKDSPFSRLDLLCCRNLLIYLAPDAKERAFSIFHYALRPGGVMFLGSSETVDNAGNADNTDFEVIDQKLRIYERRDGPRASLPIASGPGTLARALHAQHAHQAPAFPAGAIAQNAPVQRQTSGLDGRAGTWGELHFKLLEELGPPSVLVDAEHDVLHMSPSIGRYMQMAGGEPTRNVLRLAHPALRIELRAALYQAGRQQAAVRTPPISIEGQGANAGAERVAIEVRPLGKQSQGLSLVLLHPVPDAAAGQAETTEPAAPAQPAGQQIAHTEAAAIQLAHELDRLKFHLRDTVEQYEVSTEELKSGNEELQSMNEELCSATEELETGREELQSINEELTTVNHELKDKIDQLGQSNGDMQNLMDATAIATIFLDRDIRVTRYTPSAVGLFNLIPGDLGRPLSDLNNQLDYPDLQADAAQVLATLAPVEREIRDSADNWYIVRARPYRTLDDRIAGLVFTFVDITERKRSQEALRSANQRFAAVVNQASVGVLQVALDGKIVYSNRFHADLLGYGADELTGTDLFELVHPDDRAPARSSVDTLVAHKRGFQISQRALRRDGGVLWLHKSVVPLTDAGGEVTAVLVVAVDLTERRQAEMALRRSEERLRLIVENALEYAIFSVDMERCVTHWSAGAERILGYKEAEMLGQRFDLLFTDEDRAACIPQAEVDGALYAGRAADDRMHVRKDGTRLWVSGALMAMQGPTATSGIVGFVKIMRDQTEQRLSQQALEASRNNLQAAIQEKQQAGAALEAADAAKDRFLAVLAHELRNPLASVGAAADVLLSDGVDALAHARAAWMVRSQVDAMRGLLSDLLDVSLLRLGKLVLQLRRVELGPVVHSAVEATRHAIDAARHVLTLELPDAPVMLRADPIRMSQVLSNLLLNATKYTPQGGQLRLEGSVDGQTLTLSVADNGIGMRPESVESMFDMFTREQTGPGAARNTPGLGVGLALARSIVTLHGGTIGGHSAGPGKGSRFTVRLPLSLAQGDTDVAPPAANTAWPASAGLRVLVVDDNVDAVWGLTTLLRAIGHRVDAAHTGAQGLELASQHHPDVVLLDIGLPDLSGLEVARRIRALPGGQDALLVAATGWGGPQDHADCQAAGFDAHLVKPIDLSELRRLMTEHAQKVH